FEGLKDLSWFDRMNAFGARYGLEIEHYIVSAGLEDMIDGTPRTMFKPTTGADYWAEQKTAAPRFGQRRQWPPPGG
ncbi:MAG: hypothetical protein U1E24_12220, partial [Phenylobacterium sp.]|nr:hypothetical protein [Phenylobacterium sp.]